MYKLSKQPIQKILQKMTDFEPLTNRIGIYRVKENFIWNDNVYEKGELVALCGHGGKDCIVFVPYESYLKVPTMQMAEYCSDFDNVKDRAIVSISKEEFNSKFELCSHETEKVEEIRSKAIQLKNEKESKQEDCKYDPYDTLIWLFVVFSTALAGSLAHINNALYVAISFYIISFICLIFQIKTIIIHNIKKKEFYRLENEYDAIFKDMDEQREKDGLFIPNKN